MIWKYISENDFIKEFEEAGRGGGWTAEGLRALYSYLDANNFDTELDVIGLDCDYSEYDLMSLLVDYSDIEYDTLEDAPDAARKYLEENTILIYSSDDCYVFLNF